MPQSGDELRAEMERRFGDPVSEAGPMKFMQDNGWTLHRDWTWSKPGVTLEGMSDDEYQCVRFLIEEWDFGGVR